MTAHRDEYLNLEQLLTRCKQLDPKIMIRVYFDPDTYRFYISYLDEMDFFLPAKASFINICCAGGVRLSIEIFIAQAIHKISEKAQP